MEKNIYEKMLIEVKKENAELWEFYCSVSPRCEKFEDIYISKQNRLTEVMNYLSEKIRGE